MYAAAQWTPKTTENGTVYWWCRATEKSVWDEPDAVREARVAAGVAVHDWVAAAGAGAGAAADSAGGKWFKVQGDNHVPCWWNSETGEEWCGDTWPLPWEASDAQEEEGEAEEAEEDDGEEEGDEEEEEEEEEETADATAFAPWSQQRSSDGLEYWFNSVTGEATWEEPAVVQAKRAADAKVEAKAAEQAEATREAEAECAVWSQHCDENGDEYWWNSVTGETQWDEPAAAQTTRVAAVADVEADAATAMTDAQSTAESEACVEAEAEGECADNWSRHCGENGDEYW
eukprot:Rhum_TRINITY_DN13015_c0_g1::Rhum_TRINITY_DN13015_c0_g1_i1::g.56287::m.56287